MNLPLCALKVGDVVFTVDAKGTAMHVVISMAQRIGSAFQGGHANSIHAAIATGNGTEVIEAVGSGLRKQNLSPGNYRVFRYVGANKQNMRMLAAGSAENFLGIRQETPGYGSYNKVTAAVSPFRSGGISSQAGQAVAMQKTDFYCSNFIWRCYAEAAGAISNDNNPIILQARAEISPRDLESAMIRRSGVWKAMNNGHSMSHLI